MRGYSIAGTDGEIGKVDEFYFDDDDWVIRYGVVNTGNWLMSQRVLLSPVAFKRPDFQRKVFPVSLTKEQVKDSPEVDAAKPISRQSEETLHQYYRWPIYWGRHIGIDPTLTYPAPLDRKIVKAEDLTDGDPHLRSTKEVDGYHIKAADGEIGHVEDFLVEDDTWIIRYMVIDTKNWLPGKKVLLAPEWIDRISWNEREVLVPLKRDVIEDCPEYDPSTPVSRVYEENLYRHYNLPDYWN